MLVVFVVVFAVWIAAQPPPSPPRHAVASAAYVSESAVTDGGREKIVVKVAVQGSGWDGVFSVQVAHHVLVSNSDAIECSSQPQSHFLKPGTDPWHTDRWGPITETDICWGPPQTPGTADRAQELVEVSEGTYLASPNTVIVELSLSSPIFYST